MVYSLPSIYNYWTGLVDWTGGLTYEFILMVSNTTHYSLYEGTLTSKHEQYHFISVLDISFHTESPTVHILICNGLSYVKSASFCVKSSLITRECTYFRHPDTA